MRELLQTLLKSKSIIKKMYHILFNLIGYLPVKKDLIIFESFLGKQYSDNPRAIYEYLKEHHPEYQLLWSIDKRYKQNFLDAKVSFVNRFSIKWLLLMPRANYWVINSRMPYWIRKPKHTVYLQTWHGTPLKKLAADMEEVHMPGTTTDKYKQLFLMETRNWDYLISPNRYSTDIFQSAFQYNKEKILETGYPRNDYLINNNTIEAVNSIKKSLGLPKNKKIILYAPTWRDDEYVKVGQYKFTLHLELEQLQRSLGDEYVILLRMHYLIANKMDVSTYKGFAHDFSKHDDIRDLYLISDVLITDYSSVFFDYLCLKRPIIFYTYDIDSYRDKLRGFYFDIEKDAPGTLAKTTEEVLEAIKSIETKRSESLIRFHQEFCNLEKGISTERVVKSVFLERATK
ncbi:CDP-glycerol glycerophosphotransferase family protein [Neobacillus drentensis]|uniref:CDP-glycerol glycerophosphotransferase family protein n=1 Tax=Neobacillus drentensis TaxID=220684 RepID=UPI002FFF8506